MRKSTGDNRYRAAFEEKKFSLSDIVVKVIGRPMKMLFTEPMLAASVGYILVGTPIDMKINCRLNCCQYNNGCLYLYFEAYGYP